MISININKIVKQLGNIISVVALLTISYFGFAGTAFADYSATSTYTTSGTFIVPAGVTNLTIDIVGGGGGGAGGAFTYGGGGGGSGSSISNASMSVTPGQSIPYIIGTGGNGGASGSFSSNGGNGGNGGTSYFGFLIFANGGNGGRGAIINGGGGQGGATGGVGGTNGTNGDSFIGQRSHGGTGGTNPFGTGGVGGTGNSTSYTLPTVGTIGNGGGAGSGWALYAAGSDAGARGGNGYIRVRYYADLTAPVITILGSNPVTIPASSVYVDAGATAFDNTFGTTSVSIIFNNVNTSATGTYSVVYSATDGAGNTATSSRTVIVTDQSAPIITAPIDQIFEATGPITTPVLIPATAIDNIDPNPVVTYSPNSFALGTTTVLWTATDSDGNSSTTTSLVIIKDTTAPAIVLNGSSTLSFMASTTQIYTDLGANAFDLVDGTTSVSTIFNNVDLSATGTYSVIYSSSDLSGNTSTSTRTVIVTPLPAPVLTSISISPLLPIFGVGTSTQFIATTLDQYGNPFPASVIFISSNNTVGTIDPFSGVFNSLANGTTSITAFSGAISTSTLVTVSTAPAVLTSISISPLTPSVSVGTTTTFISTTLDQYNNPFATSTTWTSSSSTIGTIDPVTGVFTALSLGTTTITGTAGTLSTSTDVTVIPAVVLDTTAPTQPVITFTSATGTIITQADISWTDATDTESGVAGYLYLFNNVSGTQLSLATPGVATTSATTTSFLSLGSPLWFHVASIDNAGNVSSSTEVGPFVISDSAVLYRNSTVGGTFYTLFSPSLAQSVVASTTGSTTLTNSTLSTFWNINDSVMTNSSADDVNLNTSNVSNSTLINSDITNCTIINSLVKNYFAVNCYIAFSTIDPSILYHFVNSTSTNSQVYASDIYFTTITDNSYVATSTASSSTISNSTVTNSNLSSSTVATSTLSNVVDSGSTITNTTLSNATTTNAVIDSGIIYSGTITIGGNTYVISTPTTISSLIADTVPPVITINGLNPVSVVATTTGSYIDAGATAFDAVDGTTTVNSTSTVDITTVGTYSVDYSATDIAGNTATSSRVVNVTASLDTVPPVITLFGLNPDTTTVGSIYTDAGASSTDNVDGDITAGIVVINNVNTSATGTYTIDYSSTDSSGNTATTSRIVNVVSAADTIPPVISIIGLNPLSIIATTTPYLDLGATYTDNVDGGPYLATTTSNNVNPSIVGTYSVDYSATDVAGNTATTSRVVNVISAPDTTPPVIIILGSNPISINVGSVYSDAGATANDNVDGNITGSIVTTNNVNTSATGTYTVDYSVVDSSGNGATSTRTVNVIAIPTDSVPPVITVTGGTPITVYINSVYTDQGATALDNIDGNISANIVATNNVNTSATGTYSVIYNVSDNVGNAATAGRVVNVIDAPADTIAPVITVTGGTPTTVLENSVYTDQGATANDNIDGAVAVTTTGTVDTSILGTYTITYSAIDSALNGATTTRTVNVVIATTSDIISPAITIIGGTPITITVGGTYIDQGATALDDVDGDVTSSIATSSNVNTSVVGSYQVTYTANDIAGNISSAIRDVNVIAAPADVIPPVIFITGGTPVTVLASTTYTDLGATYTDNVDGGPFAASIASSTVDTNNIGVYTVTYSATDVAGNVSTAKRTINVIAQDLTAPTISVIGVNPMSVTIGTSYTELGAVSIDNFDGDITSGIITTGSVNTSATGTYTIIYTSTDSSGNIASSTRTVNVVPDLVPPTITITGANPVNILVGAVYTDAGATANDNVDGNLTGSIVSTSTVNTAVVGTYSVTYSVVDSSGNGATSSRTVNVNAPDTVPPVITILGSNPANVALNSVYTDAGATANDAVDGPTAVTVLSNNVNTSATGTYQVVYSSTDIAGNTSTSTRVVNVLADTVPPVITILGSNPVNITVGTSYTDAGATAFDAVNGTTTVSATGTVNTVVAGTYIITYTSTDLSGNGATSSRTVNVNPVTSGGGGGGGSFGGGGTVYNPGFKIGDINKDGKVDKYDFALLMVYWNKIKQQILAAADLNNDGIVNKFDLVVLMLNWGK